MATASDATSDVPADDPVLGTVQTLLDAAGLHPPASDVVALARAYPGLQRRIEGLYRVPTGDDGPAPVFQAELGR